MTVLASSASIETPPEAPRTALWIDPLRLSRAKTAYTTRFLAQRIAADSARFSLLTDADTRPAAGDVVLARVDRLGQHKALVTAGSRTMLFPGDEVLVAYGHRYAPDQYEASVPNDLGPVQLVAAGGVAGQVQSTHTSIGAATQLTPLGILCDAAGPVSLRRLAPHSVRPGRRSDAGHAPVIAVLGTSMNSGKTTTAAAIVRGLARAGRSVAAGKITGTGASGDPQLFRDSGAGTVLDFTDFGFASTYREPHETVSALTHSMLAALATMRPDAIVIEIADGVLQHETARIVSDPALTRLFDHVVFAAGEALGAAAGCARLRRVGVDVALVSGLLTASPLAMREASDLLDVPVCDVGVLSDPAVAPTLFGLESAHGHLRAID